MKGISVLSFGYTRGLWDGENAEDFQRMIGYAAHLDEYIVVANSYKRHGLKPRHLAPHVEAIPTDGIGPLHSLWRMFWIGAKILRERRISLIQAQDPLITGMVAVVLGKIFHLPVNVCIYGPNVYDPHWLASHWSYRLLAPVSRWIIRQCRGIQVDGQLTARRLIAAGVSPERVAVKPVVPMNLEAFLQIERAPHTPARLLFAGRFAAQKNLGMLMEVVKILRARGASPFELTLVGEGPGADSLQATVAREGWRDIVKFRGQMTREQIAGAFADADIFVLTSDFEGFPRVLMEAAAAALPIVTTGVSGADEAIVDGTTGYIVPVRATEAFAEKLASLIASPELRSRMGNAARAHIRPLLDPATNAPAQAAIWRRVARVDQPAAFPKRLLLFNLVTDVKHPVLGFTTQWIRELARRVESIDVITMRAGEIDVPANVRVHSVGSEHGWSEPRRAIEFYRILFSILRSRRIDGCFSHMIQIFSVLAGPVLRMKRIPLITWFAHPQLSTSLKLGHFFSNRMVTSLPGAYPYRKNKLSVIGQGIDTTRFTAADPSIAEDGLILCAGRISRVKNHAALLRATALMSRPVRVVILGAVVGVEDEVYAAELRALITELRLDEKVTFAKPVPPAELPAHYQHCAVHVNLTPAGFGDKVAWEAMSCGRPCLVANDDFRETLGEHHAALLFHGGDPADLAAKLNALLEKTPAERAMIGLYLRSQVERLHSLPRLAERILAELGELLPPPHDPPVTMPAIAAQP